MHNGLLTKDGKKISKSDPGTIVLMSDLLETHAPDTLRALFLTSHYRRPIDYGPSRLDEIARGLQAFHKGFERFERLTGTSLLRARGPDAPRRLRPRRRRRSCRRSPSIAGASSTRWTTTSTPAARSASSTRWSTP